MLSWIVDRRATLLPVGDQAARDTCLSWAFTSAHEFTVSDGPFSIEYLHWSAGNQLGERGTVFATAGALRAGGQPEASQWPYLEANDDTHPGYLPPGTVIGPFSKASTRVSRIDVDTLIVELTASRLPVICLRITDAFLAASGGVIRADGAGADGHAVVAVGIAEYKSDQDLGVVHPDDRLVCIRNSWSPRWGIDGYALMTEDALSECGVGALIVDSLTTS